MRERERERERESARASTRELAERERERERERAMDYGNLFKQTYRENKLRTEPTMLLAVSIFIAWKDSREV